jgi:hypothetical protein
MSWLDALIDAFFGGPVTDGSEDYRENGFTAYKLAWLDSLATGDVSDQVLTDQLDRFATFKKADGTSDYPEILLEAWREGITPASARKLLTSY